MEMLDESAIQVSGCYNFASKLALLKTWKSNFTEAELLDIVPAFVKEAIEDVKRKHDS